MKNSKLRSALVSATLAALIGLTAIPASAASNRNTWEGTIQYTGTQVNTSNGNVGGEVIGDSTTAAATLALAFDGDTESMASLNSNPNADGVEGQGDEEVLYWLGIKTTQAIVPTQIRISLPTGEKNHRVFWSYIQASKDGVNWTTLEVFDDWKDYDGWAVGTYKTITVNCDTDYQYFRYFNYEDRGANRISEFQVFGSAAPNTVTKWNGELVSTGENSTSVCGSVVGEIIGGGADAATLAGAFDGDVATYTDLTSNTNNQVDHWFGIKTAEPIVPSIFRIAVNPHHNIYCCRIQGSNDGKNWETLAEFSDWKEYATPAEGGYWPADATYKTIDISTTKSYQYFRYFNYNEEGANRLSEFQIFGAEGITHPNTRIDNVANATITTPGYTGDVYCDDCDALIKNGEKTPTLVEVEGTQLSLEGVIGVKFRLTINDENLKGSEVVLTVNNRPTEHTISGAGTADYRIDIYAKELADTITVKIGDDTIAEFTAQANAEAIINGDNYPAEAKALAKALLNYGAAAQVYFGHNTSNLANKNLPAEEQELLIPDNAFDGFAASKKTTQYGTFIASSVKVEASSTLNIVFEPADEYDINNLTFTANGKTLETRPSGNNIIVEISGIKSNDLDNVYKVTVNDAEEFVCSVFGYGRVIMKNSDDTALQNVMKAMYLYNAAANEYANAAANAYPG